MLPCAEMVQVFRQAAHASPTRAERGRLRLVSGWSLSRPSRSNRKLSELHPRALRDSPIAGVVLASADLDHVVGLLLLRELQPLRVYAAPSILRILREENSMFGMLNRIEHQVVWTAMKADAQFPLLAADGKDSGLRCEVHYLSGRYPKYVKIDVANLVRDEATAALFFEAAGKRSKRVYIPAVEASAMRCWQRSIGADLLLFDGTFWSDDELQRVQGSGETAHQMGHIPVEESLRLLKDIRVGRKMFIHLNNTNPMSERGESRTSGRAASWLGSGGGQLASGTVAPGNLADKLTFEQLRAALRQVGEERYHHKHPFHLLMHEGKLSRGQLQAWALNRYYYQSIIPIKDAIILSRATDPSFRRVWRKRIVDHDGRRRQRNGGILRWIKLAEATGLDRERVISAREVLPATRFIGNEYLNLVRTRPFPECVASSLTEFFRVT